MTATKKLDQVLTIRPDGSIAGLQRKDGLDLRQLGKADIKRASEVLWDEDRQQWYVVFRKIQTSCGALYPALTEWLWDKVQKGVTRERLQTWAVKSTDLESELRSQRTKVFFDEYEDAVQAEIQTLDFLRLRGLVK